MNANQNLLIKILLKREKWIWTYFDRFDNVDNKESLESIHHLVNRQFIKVPLQPSSMWSLTIQINQHLIRKQMIAKHTNRSLQIE